MLIKNEIQRTISITSILLICCLFLKIEDSNGAVITVKNNKSLSLCKEIKQVLEEPVNEQGKGYNYRVSNEFSFPKKYKNFSLLNWKDLDVKDIRKHILSEEKLAEIEGFNKRVENKAHLLLQKARVDINHDGKNETFIRFKSSDIKVYDKYSERKWNYYVSDVDPKDRDISKAYSKRSHFMRDGIFPFYYKGRFYQSNRSVDFDVYEGVVVDPDWIYCKHLGKKCDIEYKQYSSLGMILVCHLDIKLTRQEAINSGFKPKFVDKLLKNGLF